MRSCKVNKTGVWLDGKCIKSIDDSTMDWKKDLYSDLQIEYPKFHKMDSLAKMAFLAFNYMQTDEFDRYNENEVSLLFANKSSSLTTDLNFQESYLIKGSPSPSLFVYTLPNILTGELSIFKKWYGENIFYIEEKFDPEFFLEQINFIFTRDSKACLAGWVESNIELEEAFLFFISNKEVVSSSDLNNLYNIK